MQSRHPLHYIRNRCKSHEISQIFTIGFPLSYCLKEVQIPKKYNWKKLRYRTVLESSLEWGEGLLKKIVVLAIAAEEQTLRARKKAPYLTWIWHSSPFPPPSFFSTEEKRNVQYLAAYWAKSVVRNVYTQPWNTYVQYTTRYWCLQRLWKDFFCTAFSSSFLSFAFFFFRQLVFPVGKWVGSPSPVFVPTNSVWKEGEKSPPWRGKRSGMQIREPHLVFLA